MSIEILTGTSGARVLLTVTGRLDFPRHAELRRAYEAHPPGTAFDVDLSAAEYLDSSALGMLLLLRRHAGDEPESVRLLHPAPAVRRILDIANFSRLFRMVTA